MVFETGVANVNPRRSLNLNASNNIFQIQTKKRFLKKLKPKMNYFEEMWAPVGDSDQFGIKQASLVSVKGTATYDASLSLDTTVIFGFKNTRTKPIEAVFELLKPDSIVYDFLVEINGERLKSKCQEKKKVSKHFFT
jgi:hypothetical protein